MNTETLEEINCKDIRIELSNDTSTTSICYSVYYNNIFAGSASVSVTDTSHLKDIFIERSYRRIGIGKYLINYFNIKRLECTTWNHIGITFYKAIGFIESKRDIYLITFIKEHPCMKLQ